MTICCWCNKDIKLGLWRFWTTELECPHCHRPVILSRSWVTKKPESYHLNGRRGT